MTAFDGVDLADLKLFAPEEQIPLELSLYLSLEVARALASAHDRNVVHGELDAHSILVSWTGEVRVTDFAHPHPADPKVDVEAFGTLLQKLTGAVTPFVLPPRMVEIAGVLEKRVRPEAKSALVAWMRSLRPPEEPRRNRLAELFDLKSLEQDRTEPSSPAHLVEPTLPPTAVIERNELSVELTAIDVRPDLTDPASEAPPPKDPLLGVVLHGYRLIECISGGSWSRVYRAEHVHLAFSAAIKVLTVSTEQLRARLIREAKALATLRHANIVSVLDCGVTPSGAPFLTMELLEGRTLREAIRVDGRFPLARVKHIAQQLAFGLAAAHRHGVVHRDLKPANIMLVGGTGSAEQVKIVDFGLVRLLEPNGEISLTGSGQILGTPAYMSPEQVQGSHQVGPSTDLYSLGVVLYELAAGKAPFSSENVLAVIQQQLQKPPPPLPDLHGFEKLVLRLLEKTPEARFPSAEAFLAALEELDEATKLDEPETAVPRPPLREWDATSPPNGQLATVVYTPQRAPAEVNRTLQFLTGLLAAMTLVLGSIVLYFMLR